MKNKRALWIDNGNPTDEQSFEIVNCFGCVIVSGSDLARIELNTVKDQSEYLRELDKLIEDYNPKYVIGTIPVPVMYCVVNKYKDSKTVQFLSSWTRTKHWCFVRIF